MSHFHFKFYIGIAVLSAIMFMGPPHSPAADPSIPADQQIVIVADQLETGGSESYIEFSGNVQATQDTTSINADSLKIYYKGQTAKTNTANTQDSIEKIIASGNVIIKMDQRTATTRQAVYTTADQKLVLSGKNSKITSGQDQISGALITFYRQSGRVKVEGDRSQRVKAIIYPQTAQTP
jgi:lipopolysaccharide export system protein LptA